MKVLRNLFIILVLSLLFMSMVISVLFLVPSVQRKITHIAENELSSFLGTQVHIDRIRNVLFTDISLYGVQVEDTSGMPLLSLEKLAVNIRLIPLFYKVIHLGNVQLVGLEANLKKDSIQGDGNWQFLIDRFQSPKKEKEKKPFDFILSLKSIVLHEAHLAYNVGGMECIPNRFSPNHIELNHLNANLSLREYSKDSLHVLIRNLNFEERSGLNLKRLSLRLKANKEKAVISNFVLQTQNGEINADTLSADYSSVLSSKDYLSHSQIFCQLKSEKLILSDFAPLVPILENFSVPIILQCNAEGRLDSLNLSTLNIRMLGELGLQTTCCVENLTHFNRLKADWEIKDFYCHYLGIKRLLSSFAPKMDLKKMDPKIRKIGDVIFTGRFLGNINDGMQGNCNLQTDVGSFYIKGIYSLDSLSRLQKIESTIQTDDADISFLFPNSTDFGKVAFLLSANLSQPQNGKLTGKVEGEIPYFYFRKYTYSNIALGLEFDSLTYKAHTFVKDPNLKLNLEASYLPTSIAQKIKVTLNLKTLKLDQLNLLDKYPKSNLSFNLKSDLELNDKKDIFGDLLITQFSFQQEKYPLYYDTILFRSTASSQKDREIIFHSDFLKVDAWGKFAMMDIYPLLQQMAQKKLPSLWKEPIQGDFSSTSLHYSLKIPENMQMYKALKLPLLIRQPTQLSGAINGKTQRLQTHLSIPDIQFNKNRLKEVVLDVEGTAKKASLSLQGKNVFSSGKECDLLLKSTASLDSVHTFFHSDNGSNDSIIMSELSFVSTFKQNEKGLKTFLNILPSQCEAGKIIYQVHPSKIEIEKERIAINHFSLSGGEQSLGIHGVISKKKKDSLCVSLHHINLDNIFNLIQLKGVDFGGIASGEVVARNLLATPILKIDSLYVQNFAYNDALLGNTFVRSYWNNKGQSIHFTADVWNPQNRFSQLKGSYKIPCDSLVLRIHADHLNMACLRPHIGTVLKDIEGEASGDISIYGPTKDLSLGGDAIAHDLSFGIEILGTRYSFSDTIHLFKEGIRIKKIDVYDEDHNLAKVDGRVNYTYFRDLSFNFQINTDRFLIFDYKKANDVMPVAGKVFVSGNVSISGEEDVVRIGGMVHPEEGSVVRYFLPTSEKARNYQYISFAVPPGSVGNDEDDEELQVQQEEEKKSKTDVQIDMIVDMNPNMQVEIIMDENTGDGIKADGEGNIQATYSTSTDNLDIHGIYTINKGTFSFNLQNIITKKFQILEGSTIRFNGNGFTNLNLDVHAAYNVIANLADLDQGFQSELSRTAMPVQCLLNVSGALSSPNLSFGVNIPSASSELNRRVNSLISSEDMMYRQVVYLLVLGRFYTPEYASVVDSDGSEMSGVIASAVSSQLNSVLGSMMKNWNFNTRLHSQNGNYSDTEVEVALSGQLLNNRLLINGNFGYRNKKYYLSQNSFIGDVDLEYKLNRSGNWRLKAYTHTNDRPSYYKYAPTTQGLGVVFKKDFNTVFRSTKKKKNNQPLTQEPEQENEKEEDRSLVKFQKIDSTSTHETR